MYFPYFRGKQYELIAIRESADLIAGARFVPIVEPVRKGTESLVRSLNEVENQGGRAILVVNPHYGELQGDTEQLVTLLKDRFNEAGKITPGILVSSGTTLADLHRLLDEVSGKISLIHKGFANVQDLVALLGNDLRVQEHIFDEAHCGKLYQKNFRNDFRVILRDGFKRRRNRDHPAYESFSDLHATFEDEGAKGFGDFLIVGDDFTEGGGPAYAVAIHITCIDDDAGGEMFVHHFTSDRVDTPTDPAGKFLEALNKLIAELNRDGTKIRITPAIEEFRRLHNEGHFPGLGIVKKLSIQHHIATLADYLEK